MKWLFLLVLISGTPVLAMLLRAQQRLIVPTCFLLGVAMFLLGPSLWTAPISWPYWPGVVRGIYVSFIDPVAIALIMATPRTRIPSTVKLAFALYCLGVLVSSFGAELSMMPIAFYGWQLLRGAILFVAIARVAASVEGAPVALIAGLSVGIMVEAGVVVYQFTKSVVRPGGTFNNSNYLGLSLDYVVFPAIALLLGTRRLWPALTVLAALAIAIFGGSRATLAVVGFGLPLTTILSILYRKSTRKYSLAGMAAILLIIAAPLMIWGANQRSQDVLESSDQMRTAMKLAARMIISDYPMGIGANEYVPFANARGYNERAGVPWNEENRVVPVHNTYYLVTAETGFIGLFGLFATLGAFILLGIRAMRRKSADESGELVPGLLATMIVISIHIAFEFVALDFLLQSLFALAAGVLVGLHARAKSAAVTPQGLTQPVIVPALQPS